MEAQPTESRSGDGDWSEASRPQKLLFNALDVAMNQLLVCSFVLCIVSGLAQRNQKGSPETSQPLLFEGDNTETLNRISAQLMNALAAIEGLQEGSQMKIAEKRRNKFEFIRFGRK